MPTRGHPPARIAASVLSPRAPARADIDIEIQRPHSDEASGRRMRVLGVDPGSNATGYGVIDCAGSALRWVSHGVLRPARSAAKAARLAALMRELGEVIAHYGPDVASVEDVFVSIGPRSALQLGQARGAALAAIGAAAVPLVEYAPARIKLAVSGSGRAGKDQMQRIVRRLLALEQAPPADAADALAAAICHAHTGTLDRLRRPRPRPRLPAIAARVRWVR